MPLIDSCNTMLIHFISKDYTNLGLYMAISFHTEFCVITPTSGTQRDVIPDWWKRLFIRTQSGVFWYTTSG